MRAPADLSSLIGAATRGEAGQAWGGPAPDGVLDAIPEAVLCIDERGTLVSVNREAERLFGYQREEILGQPVDGLLSSEGACAIVEAFGRAASPPRVRGRTARLLGHRSDGTRVPLEVTLGPLFSERGVCAVAVARPLPEAGAEAGDGSRRELFDEAVRDERDRIARDLHDGVVQRLFATTMAVQALRQTTADPALDAELARIVDELDRSSTDIRDTVSRLAPVETPEGGLRADFMAVVAEERGVLGLSPSVLFVRDLDGGDPEWRHHVLSIFRELLSNVARHARATHVDVEVRVGDEFVLLVRDDGVGFDEARVTLGRGVRNVTQRARALGGSVAFRPGHAGGTEVECIVPLPSPGDAG